MKKPNTRRGQTQKQTNKGIYKISHSKLDLESSTHLVTQLPRQAWKILNQVQDDLIMVLVKGFTLIELLVVVMILGILTAIAIPQYQKAVMKSRFAAMMPIAKTLANANEVYYAEHDEYSTDPAKLNVTPQDNAPDGVTLEMISDDKNSYVLAYNEADVPNNNYVVYQKLSENFPGNTHCEALTGNTQAEELCTTFGGSYIGENGSYTAYLLSGNGNGTFEKECTEPLVTEKACPSGCGVMTRDSAACDTSTGHWDPDDGFNEDDCPKPLGTDSKDCDPGYTGQQTREGNVCKNGTYTYGGWTNHCQAIPCYKATTCNNGVATACEAGFYLQNGSCKSCGEGATACGTDGKPTACQDGYYLNPPGLVNDGCHRCRSAGALTCGYIGSNGNYSYTEHTCKQGFYRYVTNKNRGAYQCNQCPDHSDTTSGACADSVGHPLACESGFFLSDYKCKSCEQFGTGTTGCTDCTGPNKNKSGGATSCQPGYCLKTYGVDNGSDMIRYCKYCDPC